MMTVAISPKFQLVIPRPLRDRLHLRPGQRLQVLEYAGRVELIPERKMGDLRRFVSGIDTGFSREGDRA